MGITKEMINIKFGKLLVIERAEDHFYPNGRHDLQYRCICDCGNEVVVLGIHLRSGHVCSCGCYRNEALISRRSKHKMTNTRLYVIWKNMRQRCNNPNNPCFRLYGERGIKICNEWSDDFASFYNWAIDNGYSESLTLDRINVDGNYEPNNCRWVTQKEQCNNTRRNIVIEMQGEIHTLKEWTELLGIKYSLALDRIERGWDPITTLTTLNNTEIKRHL